MFFILRDHSVQELHFDGVKFGGQFAAPVIGIYLLDEVHCFHLVSFPDKEEVVYIAFIDRGVGLKLFIIIDKKKSQKTR